MKSIRTWFASSKHRAWLYGALVAAGPLLIAAGILTGDDWNRVLDLVAAILLVGGGSLATANLTPDPDTADDQ